jgi:hypothetical protein
MATHQFTRISLVVLGLSAFACGDSPVAPTPQPVVQAAKTPPPPPVEEEPVEAPPPVVEPPPTAPVPPAPKPNPTPEPKPDHGHDHEPAAKAWIATTEFSYQPLVPATFTVSWTDTLTFGPLTARILLNDGQTIFAQYAPAPGTQATITLTLSGDRGTWRMEGPGSSRASGTLEYR